MKIKLLIGCCWLIVIGCANLTHGSDRRILLGIWFADKEISYDTSPDEIALSVFSSKAYAESNEEKAVITAQLYAESLFPITARRREADRSNWDLQKIERLILKAKQPPVYLVELAVSRSKSIQDGASGFARFLVIGDASAGTILDIVESNRRKAIFYRVPLYTARLPFTVEDHKTLLRIPYRYH